MDETPQALQLPALPHGPTEAYEALPGLPLWIWLLGGLAALGLCVLIALLVRRLVKKKPLLPPFYPLREAEKNLDRLAKEAPELPVGEVAARVSLITRQHLAYTHQETSLYETWEEFLARTDALQDLPEQLRQSLHSLFGDLAVAKYAASTAAPSKADDFISRCRDALRAVESTRYTL